MGVGRISFPRRMPNFEGGQPEHVLTDLCLSCLKLFTGHPRIFIIK
jgi:hypothetical protein